MRRLLILTLAILLLTTTAYAATDNVFEGMLSKAFRGAINLVTGVIEIPAQTIKGFSKGFEPIENEAASKTVGTVLGLFRGFGHAAGRMSWGAIELVGFWAANPEDNKGVGIPLDAEYAWEEGTQYSIFEPSLAEGLEPVGNKLGRGLANTFLGIMEVPGQTIEGGMDGNVLLGFGRGIWYWFSREVYGIGSIFSCIVPNPEDNPGYPLSHEWPWEPLIEDTD